MNIHAKRLLLWAMCLQATLIFGQTTFQKTIEGPGNETGTWVIETSNGYLVAGQTTSTAGNQDALLIRLDNLGNTLWQKRFGGAQADLFNAVVETSDGYLAVGETRSFGAGNADIFIVKVNPQGEILWSRTIGNFGFDESARGLQAIDGGGFLISGISIVAGSSTTQSVFIYLDENGNTLWSQMYLSSISNLFNSNYTNGNTIFASGGVDGESAYMTVDLATGSILSSIGYAGIATEALYYQQPTQDGNLVIADHTHSALTGVDIELWVQKIKPATGEVIWSKVYYRASDNLRGRIERVNDGGFLLVPYDNFNTSKADALLAKIDANGQLLWSYNYGGNAADRLIKAVQTTDGGFIAVGDSRSNSANGSSDILLVKTDANGFIQGHCPKDGKIQSAVFTANTYYPNIAEDVWNQAVTLNTVASPLDLVDQNFTPDPMPTVTQNIQLCPNQSVMIGGVPHFAPQTLSYTTSNLNGCDTIYQYNLTALPYETGKHVIGLCPGESILIDGITYEAPASFVDTIASTTNGCDSVVTVTVFEKKISFNVLNVNVCPGTNFEYEGVSIAVGDSREFHFSNAENCDSAVIVFVNAFPETVFGLNSMPSCTNAPTGILEITSLSGGAAPFRFSLNNTDFQDSTRFVGISSGAYTAYVEDANGCVFERDAELGIIPELNIQLAGGILPCDTASVQLEAMVLSGDLTALRFVWSNGGRQATNYIEEAGPVWVEVTDQCETVRQEALVQWAELAQDLDLVYVPNVFKPAAKDAENAEFKPFFAAGLTLMGFHFEVYDRWGSMLFETSSTNDGWGGIFREHDFNPGVLVWHLEADVAICGRVMHLNRKGDVMVVR